MINSNINAEYELTLQDYFDIVRRRAILMVAIFAVVIVSASAVAFLLPPVYQSSGTILIESQQISSKFISNSVTGFASERIEVIKQRVMTRENLLRMMKKYGLFSSKNESRVTSELIANLRNRISIQLLNTRIGGNKRRKATIAFSISFEDRYAQSAYEVTNELVTLFLDENVKSRVERATETTEFLSQEARRLKADLEKTEALVAAYKQENANSLPEHLALKVDILQRTEIRLADLNRNVKAQESEISRLDLELTAAKSGENDNGSRSELARLKTEYSQARVRFNDTHPTLRTLKRRIELLEEAKATGQGGAESSDSTVNTQLVLKIESLLSTANSRLNSFKEQLTPMRRKIADLEQQIILTPQVELGLSSLLRDYNTAINKYEEIQAKQLGAQIAENLEGENKSERFSLIDPPLLADKPIKPNRLKIVLLGVFLAFAAAIGIVVILEVLNQRIRGKGALTTVLGQGPLVEIPYIMVAKEQVQRKGLLLKAGIAITVLFIVSLVVVHFAYMELDLLFYKILAKLG